MIMGLRRSLQDFTSPVGNRSSAHCLFGQAVMMHCSWVHYVHWSPHKGAWLGAAASPLSSVLMDALMATILLIQNSLKLSIKMSTCFLGMDCFLPRRVLTTLNSFLVSSLRSNWRSCQTHCQRVFQGDVKVIMC